MSRSATTVLVLSISLAFLGLGCGGSDGPGSPPAADSYAFSLAWGSYGSGDGQFVFHNGPAAAGVAVDTLGNVYVADWGNHRLLVFDAAGAL